MVWAFRKKIIWIGPWTALYKRFITVKYIHQIFANQIRFQCIRDYCSSVSFLILQVTMLFSPFKSIWKPPKSIKTVDVKLNSHGWDNDFSLIPSLGKGTVGVNESMIPSLRTVWSSRGDSLEQMPVANTWSYSAGVEVREELWVETAQAWPVGALWGSDFQTKAWGGADNWCGTETFEWQEKLDHRSPPGYVVSCGPHCCGILL